MPNSEIQFVVQLVPTTGREICDAMNLELRPCPSSFHSVPSEGLLRLDIMYLIDHITSDSEALEGFTEFVGQTV